MAEEGCRSLGSWGLLASGSAVLVTGLAVPAVDSLLAKYSESLLVELGGVCSVLEECSPSSVADSVSPLPEWSSPLPEISSSTGAVPATAPSLLLLLCLTAMSKGKKV